MGSNPTLDSLDNDSAGKMCLKQASFCTPLVSARLHLGLHIAHTQIPYYVWHVLCPLQCLLLHKVADFEECACASNSTPWVTKVQYESFREVTMKKYEAFDWFSVFKSGVLYVWEGCLPTKHTEYICTTSKSHFLHRCSTAFYRKIRSKSWLSIWSGGMNSCW